MDKKDRANKRRQDKHHKKPPPTAKTSAGDKSSKEQKPPSSAPLIVYDDPFSRRPIESNWSRERDLPVGHSDSDDDDEDHQLRAADLEKLLQLPPSASGHFFLSTEKHWIDDQANENIVSGKNQQQQYGQYFRIDTKQLNLSLGTIPFHERNGYSEDLFSKREIDSMVLKTTYETRKYQDYCNKQQLPSKMADPTPRVTPPVKCLIGPDALPPGQPPAASEPTVQPPQPVPCLVGPMALPPELRHDPNVTGSYASAQAPEVLPVDVVPIEESNAQDATEGTTGSKEDKEKTNTARKDTAPSETKEDIQQWLDDILDS